MPQIAMLAAAAKRVIRSSPFLHDLATRSFTLGRVVRKRALRAIDRQADERKLMINLGGGHYFRRHWRVLDFPSPNYRFGLGVIDYPHDLTSDRPFPLADGSVAFYFCSHTLEHIPQEHCQHVLDEMGRTLRPGGAARFTMPDYALGHAACVAGDEAFFAKYPGATIEERFLDFFATYMKDKVAPETFRAQLRSMSPAELADHYTRQIPRDSQRDFTGHHINWWTYDKLAAMLAAAGFGEVYRSTPQGSRFAEMRGVGRDRGFDSTHPEISLFVEAIK